MSLALTTPAYVVDAERIRRNAEILAGIKARTGCKLLLALKAFSMPAAAPLLQGVLDGTWTKADYYGHLKDGFNFMAPYGKRAEQATRDEIEATKKAIMDRPFRISKGPLKDNKGVEKVAAGAEVSADDRQAINWLVEGVS